MDALSALGLNLPGLIAQIINFALLITILYILLYKPVVRMLDQRSKAIQDSLSAADKVKEEAAKGEEEVKKRIDQAALEGRNMVAQATQVADRLREEARNQARQDAEAILVRARAEIERERDDAIEELRRQFADLTITAAERVIKTSLNKDQHQRLIQEVLEQSPQLRKN